LVTRWELVKTFFTVGLTAWGGPAIVAQIRQAVVFKKRWVTEEDFRESLAFCQTLPGPIAVQTAGHLGWRFHGGYGVFLAEVSYVLPCFLLMVGLSWAYFRFGQLPWVEGLFKGLGAAVVGIVAESILSMGQAALRDRRGVLLSVLAAAGFFAGWGALPVLLGSALAGIPLFAWGAPGMQPEAHGASGSAPPFRPGGLVAAGLVAALFAFCVVLSGRWSPSLPGLGWAMVKVNALSFGGGYTSIALMYHEVVTAHAWLTAKEFIDGLALGQVTPGPVSITATFIGYRLAGAPGGLFATVAVWLPSAVLLTVLAPHFHHIRKLRSVQCMVRGLLAAFIAMLFLVLWQVATASITDPATTSMSVAALLLLRLKVNPLWIVLGVMGLSLVLFL
jgi:chromate transporter